MTGSAMGLLHTVNKSPFASSALESCLRHATAAAAVLLIEDGVYAALADTDFASRLADAASRLNIYVLTPDLEARGLAERPLVAGVRRVDYGGFVDLVVDHPAMQAWF